jgi:DNA-directed RNA polymerase specialized sigma24 family protein
MRNAGRPELFSEQEFTALLLEVRETLIRYWRSRGYKNADLEDATEEGIRKCLMSADKWAGRATIKTFLTRVGINGGRDYFRKEKRQAVIKERFSEATSNRPRF